MKWGGETGGQSEGQSKGLEEGVCGPSTHIVAFSKGCVVLNQIIAELANVGGVNLRRASWLDAGNGRQQAAYPLGEDVAADLAALSADSSFEIDVIFSPRMSYTERSRLDFVDGLAAASFPADSLNVRQLHAERAEEFELDKEAALEAHFGVLDEMQTLMPVTE
jgi:hypothetical protein